MRTRQNLLSKFLFLLSIIILLASMCYPESAKSEMLIFDDFEYWTSPHNFGWHT